MSTIGKKQMSLREILLVTTDLVGFGGSRIKPSGVLYLSLSIGKAPFTVTKQVPFIITDADCVHNIILRRPALNQFKVVVLTFHLKMKFPTEAGIRTLSGDRGRAWKYYTLSTRRTSRPYRDEQGIRNEEHNIKAKKQCLFIQEKVRR